ncbi:hypothetical protein HRH59_11165 [Rheinheimera sp. YQF-2]|uniref:Uncharacterized protein n=1 Tax=Rheinheimera lutimaris TaxID=2740584 RepID=A0A7Y5ASF6_9GAMM|nr:hypothetical protein [Rheinheimera lutimaris]NRQ43101.1 hypothetical protein [Rheinheimera lutimaris]
MNMKKRVLITLFFPITLSVIYILTDNNDRQEESKSIYHAKTGERDTGVSSSNATPSEEQSDTFNIADAETIDEPIEPLKEWYLKELSEYFFTEFCRSVQSNSNVDEYIQERLTTGDDYAEVDNDISKCEGVTVKDWGQLSLRYEEELKLGNQYAELMLAKINPPGFSHGRYWLMQASTWSQEAMNDIDMNFDNVAFDEMQKLFYAKILNKDDIVNDLAKNIESSDYYEIIELANTWNTSTPKQRKVILNHELVK